MGSPAGVVDPLDGTRYRVRGVEFHLGAFDCPPASPRWRGENWIGEAPHVVFPGPAVRISQAGSDPTVVTANEVVLYNGGTTYRRQLVCPRVGPSGSCGLAVTRGRGKDVSLRWRARPGDNGAVLDHVSIQCADVAGSAAFYDAVLAPLGGRRVLDFGEVIGFGIPPKPDFWLGPRTTGEGFRESHIAFTAPDRAAVQAFFDAAVQAGAETLHEPRVWPEYHPTYYGAFVRDPDGNNVEAVCHQPE